MSPTHSIELTSTDKKALCVLLVDGREAVVGHGSAAAPIRRGEQVRWFVRSRRSGATFTLRELRGGKALPVLSGACEPLLTSGQHVCTSRRKRAIPTITTGTARDSEGHRLDQPARIAL